MLKQIAPMLHDNDMNGLPVTKEPVPSNFSQTTASSAWFSCGKSRQENGTTEMVHKEPTVNDEQPPEEEMNTEVAVAEMNVDTAEQDDNLGWRGKLARMLDHHMEFDGFIGLIIVANSICIGIETSYEIEGKNTDVFQVLEHVFLWIYIVELGLRFVAYGVSCLKDGWTLFDFVLVILGVLSLYILGPIFSNMKSDDNDNVAIVKKLTGFLVLRTLRLFRLARLLKLMVQFRTLWMLVRGLLSSLGTILYAFILIVLILYIFSCMTLELVTNNLKDNPVVGDIISNHFPNLAMTMLSLMQFVTIDSISGMYFPLVKEEPTLILLFLPAILVVSITLVNLVTAVIVEGAIQAGNEDAEAIRRYKQYRFMKMLPELRAKFREMDQDGNDLLTLEEVVHAPAAIKHDLSEFVDGEGLHELFEMIDIDESGEINSDEFCDGIAKLVNSEAPVELIRILKQLKLVRRDLLEMKSSRALNEADLCDPMRPKRSAFSQGTAAI